MDSSLITTSFAYVFRQEMDRNGADTKRRRTHFTVYGFNSVGQNQQSAHHYLELKYAFLCTEL